MPIRPLCRASRSDLHAAACHRLLPICAALSVLPGLAMAQAGAAAAAAPAAEPASAAAQAPGEVAVPAVSSPNTSDVTQLEVVVTAGKRASFLQKTPISITAVSGATLKEQGITSVHDLVRDIPGISTNGGGTGQTEYVIRGVSGTSGVAPTVGFYLDDIPLSPPATSSGGKSPVDPDLYDLARVEVLRGPQGTLYGASSMGGTIKLVPESPKMNVLSASAQAIGSKTDGGGLNGTANAALNIPIKEDVAAMRLVLTKKRLSGWIDRVSSSAMPLANPDGTRGEVASAPPDNVQRRSNDTRLEGVRAAMTIQPTSELTITPTYLYQGIRLGAPDTFDAVPGTNKHYQAFNIAEPFKDDFSIGSIKAEYDFDVATLTSVSAYSKRTRTRTEDGTENMQRNFNLPAYDIANGGLGPVVNTELNRTRQFTQEVRLASNSTGPLRWIGGVYYSRFTSVWRGTADGSPTAAQAVIGDSEILHQTIQDVLVQRAVFGNVSYDITNDLKLTGGTRYFHSTSRMASAGSGVLSDGTNDDISTSAEGWTPMANLSYNLSPTSMVYATAAKGFREGSSQSGAASNCAADLAALGLTRIPVHYQPDTVWSYEAGSKNRFFDNALTVNAAAYTQKWSNVQSLITLPNCGSLYIDNVGKAEANGFELEAGMSLTNGLSLNFSVGHVRAVYTRDDARTGTTRGQKLDGVAAWTGSSGIRYEQPVNEAYRLLVNLGLSYTGSSTVNVSEKKQLPGYTLVDARIGLKAKEWNVMLFADNLTNRRPVAGIVPALTFNATGADRYSTVRPRTIGIDFSKDF